MPKTQVITTQSLRPSRRRVTMVHSLSAVMNLAATALMIFVMVTGLATAAWMETAMWVVSGAYFVAIIAMRYGYNRTFPTDPPALVALNVIAMIVAIVFAIMVPEYRWTLYIATPALTIMLFLQDSPTKKPVPAKRTSRV